MGNLRETLESIDGATDIFFCGYDGLVIDKYGVADTDLLAATYATVHRHLIHDNQSFKEMICIFDKSFVVVRWLEDGFLGVIMGLDGNIGRAKLELNKYGGRFYK